MSSFPTFAQQELLIEGYCKRNYQYNIPIMLIKLVLSMYNEIFYWRLKGNQLQNFLSAKPGQRIQSTAFTINGIRFAYAISSNANKDVTIMTSVLKMDENIDYIILNKNIFNKECNQVIFNCSKYTHKTLNRGCHFAKLSYFTDMKEINFRVRINILRIQPKDMNTHNSLFYHKPDIVMSKNTLLRWHIGDELVTKMKSEFGNESYCKWYHSKMFDNNWALKLCQHRKHNENKYFIGFTLYSLPENIKEIEVKYSAVFNANDKVLWESDKIRRWNYDNICQETGKFLTFDKEFISKIQSFDALVDIEINELFDMNGNKIPQTDWNKYGIICDN